MRLWQKILIAPALGIVLLAGAGSIAVITLQRQQRATDDLIAREIARRAALLEIRADLGDLHSYLYRQVLMAKTSAKSAAPSVPRNIKARLATIADKTRALDRTLMETKEDAADSLQARFQRYGNASDVALDMLSVDVSLAIFFMTSADQAYQELSMQFTEFADRQTKALTLRTDEAKRSTERLQTAMLWLSVCAVVLVVSGTTISIVDLTKAKRSEHKLMHEVMTDALTGLPNRIGFRRHLEEAIAKTRAENGLLYVGYMDLDHFKSVNDRFGHAAGDEFLKTFASRVTAVLPDSDRLARLAGDEFALIVRSIDTKADIHVLAKKIYAALRSPALLEGKHVEPVRASMGIARLAGSDTPESLLKRADGALYAAKANTRNTYVVAEHPLQPSAPA